ncbi:MAG: sulfur carrier protein ThiS [Muribaculaceae bacterium]|nr:sulfur carrier protein ThiS [Muribaculaceae bacterium]
MNVTINDKPLTLHDDATLLDGLRQMDIEPAGIATAVNGKVVPSAARETHRLSEGDKIVIIKAFYGG